MRRATLLVVFALLGCGREPPAGDFESLKAEIQKPGPGKPGPPPPEKKADGAEVARPADLGGLGGRRVVLTGTVKAVTTDIGTWIGKPGGGKDAPLLILDWGAGTEVYCKFPAAEKTPTWWATGERGQRVRVSGVVEGALPGAVFLGECRHLGAPR